MRVSKIFLALVLAATSGSAIPLEGRTLLNDILVFDAPAFPDPAKPGNTLIQLQAFVSLRSIDLSAFTSAVEQGVNALGIDIGDGLSTLQQRTQLFSAVGVPGKDLTLNVEGCGQPVTLPPSSGLPDLGMTLKNVSAGRCENRGLLNAKVKTSLFDNRDIEATIFNSPDSGFGVISGMSISDQVLSTNN